MATDTIPTTPPPQNVIPVPSGQTPLGALPQYGGAGGGNQAQQYYAGQEFAKLFGRNPTQSELDQLSPSYYGGDPNIANVGAGNAAVSAYFNSLSNSPSNISANQQKQALDSYNKNPSQYDTQTQQIFQQLTGRQANSDELSHYGALLASGQIDQYGVQQLLGQTAEAQNYQTQNYQNQLSQNLQGTQGDYFKNYINPSILSQTAAAGRDPNSSGVQNAEVQAGKQQNYDLQNYLAQFGAGQYGQSAQNQQGMYQQYLGNLYGLQNADVNQQLSQQNYMQQQNTNLQNYQLQQRAYQNYLNQYGNRNNGLGGLVGGLAGAGLGAYFGGAQGANVGYNIGSGLGNAGQGAFGGRNAYL